ncbi:GYDIA family GHMP kinase [Croceitalea sp. MTPC9]|uniref:GYDIA family GHMP kinase n=1 Tax=unclassified Croceitalea TaxID=2632280 RepID=UPI002B3F2943|nr:GYDIA family GHMP kinase [Croceitalea sp. MTPC6]GMN17054.1 GYDIA family GHMP kinase [Croceitalea sp. MTPC9]
MQQEFYSNGKLLISGEYAILDGAKGLAVPTKFGQSLITAPTQKEFISWKSLDVDGQVWFTAELQPKNLVIEKSSDDQIVKTLQQILLEAKKLNPNFLDSKLGLEIETQLTFPREWGLGTSSTLINNIAQWAAVDAHQLLWNSFGGSGYDISCAQNDSPILYHIKNNLPKVEQINFQPEFKDVIYFVYLNQKQSSKKAITNYRSKIFNRKEFISKINEISIKMASKQSIEEFGYLVEAHEALLSKILEIPTIKEKLFSDYFGTVKSLGAWGGDFAMAIGNEKTPEYFKSKGFETILSFKEMVL